MAFIVAEMVWERPFACVKAVVSLARDTECYQNRGGPVSRSKPSVVGYVFFPRPPAVTGCAAVRERHCLQRV